ncbi:competence type IV pilus minor pilin ComGG [Streptococcus sp. DD11]|uniref:competence type IV pilus minor pilin ComGG n=1 Tax=Streptococcus sp. DD11 TaxID=1777879 RepID=UPI000A6CCC95|nr:competence type IV pilus minor pilin ComGG [Streptococcus sp. DD11]
MFRRKVKAGVLLYAVFMAAVFSMLLQFYLNRQVAGQRLQLLNREKTVAYAMAVWTKESVKDAEGRLEFDQGSASYSRQGDKLDITSQLRNGHSYNFGFSLARPEKEQGGGEAKKEQETARKEAEAADSERLKEEQNED